MVKPAPPPLRYVVLHHTGVQDPHYDLMFEIAPGDALMTWRSAQWPIDAPAPLTRLADHRAAFLDFEGELTAGRGRVSRVESGTYVGQPQWDDPYVLDLVLYGPTRHHFWILCPPGYPDWQAEPGL